MGFWRVVIGSFVVVIRVVSREMVVVMVEMVMGVSRLVGKMCLSLGIRDIKGLRRWSLGMFPAQLVTIVANRDISSAIVISARTI